jgi:hypothetical protein
MTVTQRKIRRTIRKILGIGSKQQNRQGLNLKKIYQN